MTMQQQVSVETPANADVVTLQVGSTLRRIDKQKDNGLLLAMVDTVTLNRKTALASDDPAGGLQSPAADGGGIARARRPARRPDDQAAPARGADLPLPLRHREEDVPVLRPDRAEAVRRELRE